MLPFPVMAEDFNLYFEDATLRLDYIMAGNDHEQHIYLEDLKRQEKWAGRKARLAEKFLNGNGQLTVRDHETKTIIYVWTFSTLFQEWQLEAEAKTVDKAFEASYNIPFPKNKVDVTITLTDSHNKVTSKLTHTVDPKDILIRKVGDNGIPYKYIWKGGELSDCIDLAILAEGYTEAEMDKFYKDSERAVEALFAWEPFKSLKDRFNVVAVAAPSMHSGPSVPLKNRWNITAANTNYSTFYSDRYLTTKDMHRVYDLLSGVPFEHVLILDIKALEKTRKLWKAISMVIPLVYLSKSHAKFMLIEGENGMKVTMLTSQNLTRGNRYESSLITTHAGLFDRLKEQAEFVIKNYSRPFHEIYDEHRDVAEMFAVLKKTMNEIEQL